MASTLFSIGLICLVILSVSQEATNETSDNINNNIRKVIIDSDGGVNDVFALIWALESFNNKVIDIKALTTVQTDLSRYDAFRNIIHMVNLTKHNKMKKKFLSIPIGKAPKPNTTGNDGDDDNDNDDVLDNDNDTDNEEAMESDNDGLFGFSEIFHKYPDILSPKKKTKKAYKTASYSDDLLIETILKYPNEISLITMGPLTNLYLAETKHPGILSLAKDIYIFGGEFSNKTGNSMNNALSEYNFNYNPNALYRILLNVDINIFIFPLDTGNILQFGLQQISLIYTLLNTDIQTEIEMCRMKMEKDADKLSDDGDDDDDDDIYDDGDLYDSDREDREDDYDDFQCTQTGLLYIFYEKMMDEVIKENYLNGYCDCLQLEGGAIMGYILYPHLYSFKYVNCKINKRNGMIWFDKRLEERTKDTITIPNCFINLDVNVDKIIHGFGRDSVNMMHGIYMDYMEYMMNQMDW